MLSTHPNVHVYRSYVLRSRVCVCSDSRTFQPRSLPCLKRLLRRHTSTWCNTERVAHVAPLAHHHLLCHCDVCVLWVRVNRFQLCVVEQDEQEATLLLFQRNAKAPSTQAPDEILRLSLQRSEPQVISEFTAVLQQRKYELSQKRQA